MPAPEQQKLYTKLSGQLQGIGLKYKRDLPGGATSLFMKVENRKVTVEVCHRMGKAIVHVGELLG